MLSVRGTSGDMLADRRFAYASALLREGDAAAAADLFEQAIERAPAFVEAWRGLAEAREKFGDRPGAVAALEKCLELDAEDRTAARLALALLIGATAPIAPPAYVSALFDAYASTFEATLVDRLKYRTPADLAALIRSCATPPFARALDLGCGTGLMAAALGGDVGWVKGVDLSAKMLNFARRRGLYGALAQQNLLDALHEPEEPYDLIVAADVFIYLGDLAPVFAAARARLTAQGMFAFSVERHAADQGYGLTAALRFAHSEDYVRTALADAGLEIIATAPGTLRLEAGKAVDGLFFAARAHAALIER